MIKQPKTLTCDCSGKPQTYPNTTQERFEHNTQPCHRLAVLNETGAPQSWIDDAMARAAAQ